MSRESREVRPFRSARSLQRTLNTPSMWCGPEMCSAGGTRTLEPRLLEHAVPVVEWAENEESFSRLKQQLTDGIVRTGLAPALTSLLLVGRVPYTMHRRILGTFPLAELETLPRRLELAAAQDAPSLMSSTVHGCRFVIALCVNEGVTPDDPLCPHQAGYWIARSTFVFKTGGSWQAINYRPMEPDDRKHYGLSTRCVRYLPIDEGLTILPISEMDPPELLIDSDICDQLETAHNVAAARLIQKELCLFAYGSIISRYSVDANEFSAAQVAHDEDEILSDSLIGWVIRKISGHNTISDQHRVMLELARSNPDQLIAQAEHTIDLKADLLAALRQD